MIGQPATYATRPVDLQPMSGWRWTWRQWKLSRAVVHVTKLVKSLPTDCREDYAVMQKLQSLLEDIARLP